MPERPELLAPAGSFDSLRAAVENGADAVYLGGKGFHARARAVNFQDQELAEAIDYAHIKGTKVYVTVNTLVRNAEFSNLGPYLKELRDLGADALIVQDLGVLRFARHYASDLPIHMSTQACVHNSLSANLMKRMGAERIILPRELTLEEIRKMREKTDLPLETFVHGALCYSYSGQCLASSLVGGRSGNRGACAYTCRLPFQLVRDGEVVEFADGNHFLSSRDLNAIDHLPDLWAAGVESFKIEGRMRRPEYVATVVSIYRRAIDRMVKGNFHLTDKERLDLMQAYNRKFTPGYYGGNPGVSFVVHDRPDNRGTELGAIEGARGQDMLIRLHATLHVGDGVEVEDPDGGTGFGQAVEAIYLDGRSVKEASAGTVVAVPKKGWVHAGSKVNKTLDILLFTDAQLSYTDRQRRIGVSVVASLSAAGLVVTLQDEDGNVGVGSAPVETARGVGMTAEALKHQLKKLGDTPFKPRQFELQVVPGLHASLSQVNAARRAAVDALKQVRTRRYKRPPAPVPSEEPHPGEPFRVERPRLAVTVQGVKLTTAACENGADAIYYAGLDWGGDKDEWNLERMAEAADVARQHRVPLWVHFPYITRDADLDYIRTIMPALVALGPAGAVVGNLGALELVKEFGLRCRADYPLNTYNSHALSVMKDLGFESACLSPEMTLAEMEEVAKKTPIPVEAVSHGQLHLMVSEHCAIGAAEGCYTRGKHVPCRRHDYELVDEKGFRFQLVTDGKCRMHLMNSRELAMLNRLPELVNAGIATLRMDTEGLKAETVGPIVRAYRSALDQLIRERSDYRFNDSLWETMKVNSSLPFTTGHFYRGVE